MSRRLSSLTSITAVSAAALLTLSACSSGGSSAGEDGPVTVGQIMDLTGPLNVYSVPKNKVVKLAIEDINSKGGVLGRQLKLKTYDSQSQTTKNVQYANQLATKDKAVVVMGGTTSASREAMRPALDRTKTLYFYNSAYEGGVCDRNIVITGESASQFIKPLVDYAVKKYGKRIYVVAADYNYGRISTDWIKEYAADQGAEVVGADFISLDSSDFGSSLSKIQSAKPDIVISALVGANHVPFYREFVNKGLGAQSKLVATAFGLGNEQEILTPRESEGILVAYNYYEELDNPANEAFKSAYTKAYGDKDPYITDLAAAEWNGWHLWAAAVEKAGTFDRDEVLKAIESGEVSFDSPSGKVTIDAPTHHVSEDITLAQANAAQGFDPIETLSAQDPFFEREVCDLVENPDLNKAFTP